MPDQRLPGGLLRTAGFSLFLAALLASGPGMAQDAPPALPGDGPVPRTAATTEAADDALLGVPPADAAIPATAEEDTQPDPAPGTPRTVPLGQQGRPYLPETTPELRALLENCDSEACMSYVSGAVGGIAVYAILAENPTPFCTGGSVPTEEIRDAIIDTIDSVPALRDQHPAVSILTAFGRYWPCMTKEDITDLQAAAAVEVDPDKVAALHESEGHILDFGAPDADRARTITVFHDPNCGECRRFRATTAELAETGWRVVVYPVASVSEDSAGYGAIQLALRDLAPDVARSLYEDLPEGTADFAAATTTAQSEGVDLNAMLRAVATTDAYARVEQNTQALLDLGGAGTPAWIVGDRLFEGYLSSTAVENAVAARADVGETAPDMRADPVPAETDTDPSPAPDESTE